MDSDLPDRIALPAIVAIDLQGKLENIASGKVRDLFKVDDGRLLFVASDRISAFDVVMKNVSLNQLSSYHMPEPGAISVVPIEGSRRSFAADGESLG